MEQLVDHLTFVFGMIFGGILVFIVIGFLSKPDDTDKKDKNGGGK